MQRQLDQRLLPEGEILARVWAQPAALDPTLILRDAVLHGQREASGCSVI